MNVVGLYGAIGWNVLISDNPKLLKQSEDSWTHGASVTLIKDGEHCVSISEERLSGIKYDGNFNAAAACCKQLSISILFSLHNSVLTSSIFVIGSLTASTPSNTSLAGLVI